jgi:hypothetical protein
MGMACDVYALSDDHVRRIEAAPGVEIMNLLQGDGDPAAASAGLEKSWHGLHYLLTGTAGDGDSGTPLGFILEGGKPVGDDLGYGPARLFGADETRAIHAALNGVSDDQLWRRFDAQTMTNEAIYPLIWDEPEDELRQEYLSYFGGLRQLVADASGSGKNLLVLLT